MSRVPLVMDSEPTRYPEVVDGLKKFYNYRVKPLEEMYKFEEFYGPALSNSEIEAKPMVLLLGQYSTGKTSFIKYLVGRDFPNMRIGPEPTTDRFVAIMHDREDRTIPGNALSVRDDTPFHSLNMFGTAFLNRFEAAMMPSPILEHVSFLDTPGVLAGDKQRLGRGYDFMRVIEWFVQRVDLILLLFDAHKLDISDEFRATIEACKGQDDKIRIVLNKADMVSPQQLMRVYGALMWSLGKIVSTPEVMRVYIGSFWDKPLAREDNRPLFEAEHHDLLRDLRKLPKDAAVRKINELVKRARQVKVHAYVISHLRAEMPSMFGKNKKQAKLIDNLPDVFNQVHQKYHLPVSDFPHVDRFREILKTKNLAKFPKLVPKMIEDMDRALSHDIPALMQLISPPDEGCYNPFADGAADASPWLPEKNRPRYEGRFGTLKVINGRVSGANCKDVMAQSGLERDTLAKIWVLADVDKDGQLDLDEFCVAMYLIERQQETTEPLPDVLPIDLVPLSKRPKASSAAHPGSGVAPEHAGAHA